MADGIRIRQLAEADWDDIVALEARAYSVSGLSEGRNALRSRGRASPTTCFVLEHSGEFGGYLLAFPYPRFRCPELGSIENSVARSRNLHIHDMVITESLRGRGLAPGFLTHLAEQGPAREFETISLVAVHGTEVFWAPLGYRSYPQVSLPQSYGAGAVYMSMELRTGPDRSFAI
ncbi:GNAT family N-acetyltransferase [Nocardia sp. NPDC051787]|uniref:GNAT family N-acetyltransferase n=1 Tax=Nocardia sp. NPDC051787 TaxID=3155415 RepID=UPI00343060D6